MIIEVNADGYGPIFYTKEYVLELVNDKIEIASKKDLNVKSIEEMTGEPISVTHIGTNIIQHNNNNINFQLIVKDLDNEKLENELDQILSTFKFTTEENRTKIDCKDPRPEVCTLECIQNPPYICGSDGKSYCTVCQACSNKNVAWYEMKASACEE